MEKDPKEFLDDMLSRLLENFKMKEVLKQEIELKGL